MMVTEGRICPDDPDLNNGGEANGKSIFVIVAITIIWRIICRAWIRIDAFIGFKIYFLIGRNSANQKFSNQPERTIIAICIIIIIREIDNIMLEFERWNIWVIKRLIPGISKMIGRSKHDI